MRLEKTIVKRKSEQSHDKYLGTRVREATNPGPRADSSDEHLVSVVAPNVTAIYPKERGFRDICISETSATTAVH